MSCGEYRHEKKGQSKINSEQKVKTWEHYNIPLDYRPRKMCFLRFFPRTLFSRCDNIATSLSSTRPKCHLTDGIAHLFQPIAKGRLQRRTPLHGFCSVPTPTFLPILSKPVGQQCGSCRSFYRACGSRICVVLSGTSKLQSMRWKSNCWMVSLKVSSWGFNFSIIQFWVRIRFIYAF